MKNLVYLFFCAIILSVTLYSCGKKNEKWQKERDSLVTLNESQKQVLDELTTAIAEIANILDTINTQERILFSPYNAEGQRYTRSQVVENLKIFEDILYEKRKYIHYLDSLMDKNDQRIKHLSSLVNYLNIELSKKDSVIKTLRADIQSKDFNIQSLNKKINKITTDVELLSDSLIQISEKSSAIIEQHETELYSVYYIIGTKKDLLSYGVLQDKGLLKKDKINFTATSKAIKADSRELSTITISGKRPKILNDIPMECYVISQISDLKYKLEIIDKKAFWSAGKMLVVQVK